MMDNIGVEFQALKLIKLLNVITVRIIAQITLDEQNLGR
jgi:hypothetical protein